MATLTYPESLWRCSTISFTLMAMSASTPQSAFNPLVFQSGPTVELWMPTVTIVPQDKDDLRETAALLRKLRGRLNKIRLYDPSRPLRGAGPGPTINVAADAAAGDTSIEVYGLTPSQAVALAADDRFGVGENLYALSSPAPSDSDGHATIDFLPPLRKGLAAGDALTLAAVDARDVTAPTGLFMLTSSPAQVVVPGQISQPLTLEFAEAPDFD